MLYVKDTTGTVASVSQRLISAAAARGLKVVGRHGMKWNRDLPDAAGRSECRIYEFCDAVLFRKVLESNLSAAAALPCRVAVYQESGVVKLATLRPKAMLAAMGAQGIEGPAGAMERAILGAVDETCSAGIYAAHPREALCRE